MHTDIKNKKRGRPKGSKNKNYQVALEIPACCMVCGSTNLMVVEGVKVIIRDVTVTIRDKKYDQVRWERKVCSDCNQRIMVRRYCVTNNKQLIPEELNGTQQDEG